MIEHCCGCVLTRAKRAAVVVLVVAAMVVFVILCCLLQSPWRNYYSQASAGAVFLDTAKEPARLLLLSTTFDSTTTPTPAPTTKSSTNSPTEKNDDFEYDSKNENDTFVETPPPRLPLPLLQYVLTTCPLNRRFEPMAGDWTMMIREDASIVILKSSTSSINNNNTDEAWQCGRALGLRLANVDNEQPILETGILSGLADHFIPSSIYENNSSSDIEQQQQQQEQNVGLAISLWMIPVANNSLDDSNNNAQQQQQPIFTLAIPQSNETVMSGSCFGLYNFQIAQYQNHFLLRYTDNDAAYSCRVLYIHQWDLWSLQKEENHTSDDHSTTNDGNHSGIFNNSQLQEELQQQQQQKQQHHPLLTHLVVVLGAGETSIFINGQGIPPLVGLKNDFSASSSSLSLLSHWSQDLRLQLFGTKARTMTTPLPPTTPAFPRFAGSIHQVSLYNQSLSVAQVDALYRQGLVNVTQMWNHSNINNNTSNETHNNLQTLIVDIPKHAVIIPQHVQEQQQQQQSVLVLLSSPNISNTVLQLAMEIASIPSHGQLTQTAIPTTIKDGQYQTMTTITMPQPPSLSVGDLVRLPLGVSNVTVEYSSSSSSSLQACPNNNDNGDIDEEGETNYKEEGCYTFFNVPRFNAYGTDLKNPPESFSYRLVALDADGYPLVVQQQQEQHRSQRLAADVDVEVSSSLILASSVVSQPILVQHVNHAPILTMPSQDDIIRMSSNLVNHDNTRVLMIEGIALSDSLDFNINRIRVDIWTQGGTTSAGRLALNRQYRHLADFNECSGRTDSAWQCVGGIDDDDVDVDSIIQTHRRMTFIAIPDDVNFILHHLQYHYDAASGGVGGQQEVVQIGLSIYDGQGGDCLSAQEHAMWDEKVGNAVPGTLHGSGCVKVEALVQVPALAASDDSSGNEQKDDTTGFFNTDLESFGLADLLFCSFVILILCVMCCCIERFRHCLARGTPIGIMDDNDNNHDGSAGDDDSSISSIDTGSSNDSRRVCKQCKTQHIV